MVWVMDLDEKDSYKELFVKSRNDESEFAIYRLTKTGVKVAYNGNALPEEFHEIEFSTEFFVAESEGVSAYYKGNELNCAFNILSFEDKENTRYYNIKLTQDGEYVSYSGEEEHKETLPAGTVLENVELMFMS